jgi:hypothetical protein
MRAPVVAAWIAIVGACGDSDLSTAVPPGTLCNPGTESACTCSSGVSGTKACTNNGQAFADCVCEAPVDAGAIVPVAIDRAGGDARPAAN